MACKIGALNSLPSPLLCEIFGHLGYDFAVLDLEHVPRSPAELEHAIRACELGGCLKKRPSPRSARRQRSCGLGLPNPDATRARMDDTP
jgi:hypothetical protein